MECVLAGADHWTRQNDPPQTVNAMPAVNTMASMANEDIYNGAMYSGMRQTQAVTAGRQSVGRGAHAMEARVNAMCTNHSCCAASNKGMCKSAGALVLGKNRTIVTWPSCLDT